jgi:type I restriction enzyme S subunit
MKNPLNSTLKWKNATLKDLVVFQRGFDITKAEQSEGNIPVISSSGITSYHTKSMANGPGVIIGRKGTLGTVFYSESDYWPHDTTLWSKNLKNNNPRFVYYFIKTLKLENYNVGNANPTLNRNHIHSLKIRIPQNGEQEKIADILSAYDDLIDTNRRRIQLWEEAARLLFREWFVYFRFPHLRQGFGGQAGHEKACPVESINSTGVKMVDGVPEGWGKGLLEDIAVVKKGRNITFEQAVDGDIPVVGGGLEPTYYHNKANVSSPVITISASGANAGYVNMYDTDIWASDCSYIDKNSTKYIYSLYLRLKSLQTAIFGCQVGAAQPHVYPRDLNRLRLLIAPDDLCAQFEQLVTPVFNLIKYLKLENQKLAQARDLLLPRLMSGAIEV